MRSMEHENTERGCWYCCFVLTGNEMCFNSVLLCRTIWKNVTFSYGGVLLFGRVLLIERMQHTKMNWDEYIYWYIDFNISFPDKDHKPAESDTDSGKGTLTSYGSSASLNSATSSNVSSMAAVPEDSPEQFEVLKHQKEIWETGIEMWVWIQEEEVNTLRPVLSVESNFIDICSWMFNKSGLVQWWCTLLTHICVIMPQCVDVYSVLPSIDWD